MGKWVRIQARTRKVCRLNGLEVFVELRDCWNWGIEENWRKKNKTQQNSSIGQKLGCLKETVKSLQLFEGIFMGMSSQGEGEGNINERRESKELRGRHGKHSTFMIMNSSRSIRGAELKEWISTIFRVEQGGTVGGGFRGQERWLQQTQSPLEWHTGLA